MNTRSLVMAGLLILSCLSGCRTSAPSDFTDAELELIRTSPSAASGVPSGTMRVLTVEEKADLSVLRTPSSDLSARSLLSADYATLCSLMVATVTHPSQDGVGIAGPQVGLNRRIVAVQRFDKAGEPFEVYPNIRIVWASDSTAFGPEGCLSVPDRRGNVLRSQEIVIEYASLTSATPFSVASGLPDGSTPDGAGPDGMGLDGAADESAITMVRDTIHGFTAVIFQHEIDHLEGILYIDRL